MVRSIFACLLVAGLPISVWSAPSLRMSMENATTELGRPLHVTLHGRDLTQHLDDIDTRPWQHDFHIEVQRLERGQQHAGHFPLQTLMLRLYPRSIGRFTLADLSFMDIGLKGQAVEITPANIEGHTVTVKLLSTQNEVWQRQQLLVTMEVETTQSFVQLLPREINREDMEIIALPFEQAVHLREGQSVNVLRQSWAVFLRQAGQQMLELPGLAYSHNGVSRYTFFLPMQSVQVKALPGYLPPTIPIGMVKASYVLPNWWDLRSGVLRQMQITLEGDGVAPTDLPAVLGAFQSDAKVTYFPAQSERQWQMDTHGVRGRVVHTLPFTLETSQIRNFPALSWRYFDPDQGRLVRQDLEMPRRLALSNIWLLLTGLLALWWLLVIVRLLWHMANAYVQHKRLMRLFVQTIELADSPLALREGLRIFAQAKGWPDNLTLTAWSECWETHYKQRQGMRNWTRQLSVACYATSSSYDLTQLRSELLVLLKHQSNLIR